MGRAGMAALGLVITAVAGAAMGQGPPSPAAITELRLFLPLFFGGMSAGVSVAERVSGECFASSIASAGRPDAWRCTAGNRILDPCFEGFEGGQLRLACARSPWSAEVTVLTPTAEPKRAEANTLSLASALPWALELSDGSRCTLLTGATSAAAGLRVNYGCEGGGRYVIGEPDRSAARWRVFSWSPAREIAARQVEVLVAWW
ncbi:MAG TPA: hypothetical protein VEL75_23220 [Candidatus Methylomirabilis sp.]|nr:hypothetical protein [Candidatus Methylomirabilis sp.]